MFIHGLTGEQALASLASGPGGLSGTEARRRLAEYGPNHVQEVAREHQLLAFAREFTHFFALILWLGAALAFAAEHFDPGQGMARLGVAIVCVILVNGCFSWWQEYRAEQAVAALRRLLPQQVTVLRDGTPRELPANELVPGDLILLAEGSLVPADCRLVEARGLRVNTATVTGEALPKARHAGPCPDETLPWARNIVLAGTSVVSGEGRAVVFATGGHTEFGRIAHLTQTAGEASSPLQREIARLSRLVALLATAMGVVAFLLGQAMGLPLWTSLLFAIGIIVANVPEGLLPTVTLALAMATQRMARRKALVRHLPAVEALGSTTVICCDKTGTLTENRMAVRRLWLDGALRDAAPAQPHPLLENAARCHSLRRVQEGGGERLLGDPMEIALARLGQQHLAQDADYRQEDELPFDTDRKRMSVVGRGAQGRLLYCKGAPESLLAICSTVWLDGAPRTLDGPLRQRLLAAQEEMSAAGLRVLAFAERALAMDEAPAEEALCLSGLIGLEDPPRAAVPAAIARCHEAGIRVIMVTGDHPHTALAIARQIGLVRSAAPVVIRGDELRRLSATQLQLALDAPEILFARVAAEQKMRIVEALRHKGEIVAVTGDGVNDAPALKTADIGIAMGLAGTDVAKAAADLILLDDNFASIVAAIEEGRAVFDNLRKFLTYILSSNIPELVPYLAFVLLRIPLPLTILQILAVDLGTDMLPALALGAEKPDPAVMRRPPRSRHERLLDTPLVLRAYLFLGLLEAAGAMLAYFLVLQAAGWSWGSPLGTDDPLYLRATSACLLTIVVMQMMNLLLCRHPHRSLLQPPPRNPYLLPSLAVELAAILCILYTPAGNWAFGTAPLGIETWGVALACALAMGLLEEGRKWLLRRSVP